MIGTFLPVIGYEVVGGVLISESGVGVHCAVREYEALTFGDGIHLIAEDVACAGAGVNAVYRPVVSEVFVITHREHIVAT